MGEHAKSSLVETIKRLRSGRGGGKGRYKYGGRTSIFFVLQKSCLCGKKTLEILFKIVL